MERDLAMQNTKRFFFSLFLLAMASPSLFAQQPNCQINFGPWTTINVSAQFNNIGFGANNACTYWVLQYQVTGFSAISLQFESATGATAPGAFGAYSGTVSSGVNPSISVACSTPTNCTATFTGMIGWYRMNLTSVTGSGTVTGTLQGYKTGYALGGASVPGGGCPGTVGTPCVVVGNVADGSAVSGAPVRIAGSDGTNVQDVLTDTSGRPIVAGGAAAGAAPAGNPVLGAGIGSGATGGLIQSDIACDSSASILYSAASGAKQLIALTASRIIYVCSLILSSDTVTNITLEYGTGSVCATGTTTLFDPLQNVLSLTTPDFKGAIRTPAGNALCIVSSATATIGGVVTYAKF